MVPNNKKPAVGGFFLVTQKLTHHCSGNNENNYCVNNIRHRANIGIWFRKSRIHALNAGNAAPGINLFHHLGYQFFNRVAVIPIGSAIVRNGARSDYLEVPSLFGCFLLDCRQALPCRI